MSLTNLIKAPLIKYVRRSRLNAYHKQYEEVALQTLSDLKEQNGQTISTQQKKLADDYAIEVFGGKEFAPWLYVYTAAQGEFKEGWIPDNYFGKYVFPVLNKELLVLGEFKSFTNVVLKTNLLPDIAYVIDGHLYDRNMQIIDLNKLKEIVRATGDDAFFKRDYTMRGAGVIKLGADKINQTIINDFGNCVIQSAIQQHDFFNEYMTGSVATIRITSVKELDGSISMRTSNLRVSLKGRNRIESASAIRIAVTNQDGDLDAYGYHGGHWKKYTEHPDTRVSFANKRIPYYKKALETCLKLHAKMPHFAIIGWDLIIDNKNQVQIIEWNTAHSGITFNEAVVGPCFVGLDWEKLKT
jgi:Sugar-transfer associated ATP-grasp